MTGKFGVTYTLAMLVVIGLLGAAATTATEVRFFRQQSTSDFVEGDFEGIALDADGALRLAPHFERLAQLEEPFVFAAQARGDDWLLGTGNSGRVVAVSLDGAVETLWTAPEPEVFALWVDPDGTTFVGSSPDGKVYRLDSDGGTEFFDPEETYIWDIARAPWGDLLVATGDAGRLYALAQDGSSRLLFESLEPHLRTLYPFDNTVLIGTAGDGLILSIDASGRVRTLFDSDQDEVTAFADDGTGHWYATAVAAEASLTQQASPSSSETKSDDSAKSGVKIEVSAAPSAGASQSRSSVVRGGAGEVGEVASLKKETAYALAWVDDTLWLGTGVEGNVYSLTGGRLALEASVDDRQVIGVFPGQRPALVTTNGAAVHRAATSTTRQGVYVSTALDTGAASRFGSLRWRGSALTTGVIRFSVRSGSSSEPDATWTDWSVPAQGDALDLTSVPVGRFLQWRAEVSPEAGQDARIRSVEISYRQQNSAPTIARFEAMDPGQVLVPTGFSPDDQIYEPAHPNREGIFTPLRPSSNGNGGRLKTLWRQGFLTLRWQAEDPNEDELDYELGFCREAEADEFLVIAEQIDETYYSFDATVLPDGVYKFRLRASDRPDNSAESTRFSEQVSEPVVVDHTPPRVLSVSATGSQGATTVEVHDGLNPIRSAEVSIDGGEWSAASTVDGLLDGRRETLELVLPPAPRLVLLRLTDAAFNAATYDVLKERR